MRDLNHIWHTLLMRDLDGQRAESQCWAANQPPHGGFAELDAPSSGGLPELGAKPATSWGRHRPSATKRLTLRQRRHEETALRDVHDDHDQVFDMLVGASEDSDPHLSRELRADTSLTRSVISSHPATSTTF